MTWQTVEAAAIRDNSAERVYSVPRPGRHHDVIRAMVQEHGLLPPVGHEPQFTQGFVLADGTFVDRWNARRHAIRTGQIVKTKWGNELYSEDLW